MSTGASDELRFDGRAVIVTGAGAGMGREHALLFATRGASVVVNDLFEDAAQSTCKAIEEAGGLSIAVHGSVAEQEVVERIVNSAIETYGRLDVLVNNAGIEIKKPFEEFTKADVSRMFAVHFHGSWNLSQLVWPHMQKQSYGKIVMVCSTSIYGMPQNAAYASAKGALLGLAKSLAIEGREHNIAVNAFAPAAFTNMAKQMLADGADWDWMSTNYPAWATSPVCCWLCHETCPLQGQIVSSWGRNLGKSSSGKR
jgi:NAD(P)-dependent dehydrogenase (short-subunit alcohol dehydrogenase family)